MTTVLAVAAVVGATLPAASPAQAVAKGEAAATGQFPYSVKLTMTDIPNADGTTYDSACSAGLISPQWIITAGHCFHDTARNPVSGPVPYKTVATLGKADVADTSGEEVDVVEVRQAGTDDIAPAKLAKPVEGLETLRIPDGAPTAGEQLVLAGWGARNSTDVTPSTHLYYGKVAVSSVADTTAGVQGVWPAADTSACTYDSGAPYFSLDDSGNATIAGVESDGPDCPHTTSETVGRVDVVADWIGEELGY
ncbi:S1 family peptidase [Amycolatopsis sp.]|uniref:S1 family peptidase n=1 Tax=Amycolatopsis sp. TaxID=37632 RepID=UPI002CE610FF|nr:trypsin-like serine protease [Amycolatopsis sp.]HVV10002.1 trypsin-like serine protease [Amycolatopsis sp.]